MVEFGSGEGVSERRHRIEQPGYWDIRPPELSELMITPPVETRPRVPEPRVESRSANQGWFERLIERPEKLAEHAIQVPGVRVEVSDGTDSEATKPHLGPVHLTIASAAGGEVSVFGLLSPARIVDVVRADEVVAGNSCELIHREHYHLDSVAVTLDGVLEAPDVRKALSALVNEPASRSHDAALVRALARAVGGVEEIGPTEVDLPLARSHVNLIHGSGVVQLGDDSRITSTTEILVRRTVLSGAELLLGDRDLRLQLADAIREGPTGQAMERFLVSLLRAGDRTGELDLLRQATDETSQRTRVFALFGFTRVSDPVSVLAGTGNRFTRDVRVHVEELGGDEVIDAVAELHEEMSPPPSDIRTYHTPTSEQAASPDGSPHPVPWVVEATFEMPHIEDEQPLSPREKRRRRGGGGIGR
ncbi:hypothetical protein GCE86_17865 [Micromonospora terminaliae]|uniref:Uncharacterized protein n=1 Tax=Micromonospora terminaliae TaxID=1914461 RepID=A0AAJ3DK43_9ACTN|nr:hypothetical protein [Micromonospora terminaliae]NES29296.1 hypothetical protein [Micromonospora terminaliae]QGL48720.1 hypothetical protein GCE86_17865 [Micromonospora terminaliae]